MSHENENRQLPRSDADERKAWTEPHLIRLGIDLQMVEEVKNPGTPYDADDHTPSS